MSLGTVLLVEVVLIGTTRTSIMLVDRPRMTLTCGIYSGTMCVVVGRSMWRHCPVRGFVRVLFVCGAVNKKVIVLLLLLVYDAMMISIQL